MSYHLVSVTQFAREVSKQNSRLLFMCRSPHRGSIFASILQCVLCWDIDGEESLIITISQDGPFIQYFVGAGLNFRANPIFVKYAKNAPSTPSTLKQFKCGLLYRKYVISDFTRASI